MTTTFFKSTTAIVLSLSLAVPTATMAQTAAELEAAFDVDTSTMTEAELDSLRQRFAEMQANTVTDTEATEQAATEVGAATDPAPLAEAEAPAENDSLLDRAVGAVKEGLDGLTGSDEPAATAEATPEAEATTDTTAEADAEVTEEPAAEATAEAEAEAAEAVEQAETEAAPVEEPVEETTDTAEAPAAEPVEEPAASETAEAEAQTTADTETTAEADAEVTEEPAVETTAEAETDAETTGDAEPTLADALNEGEDSLQAQVDDLQKQLDALSNETAEEQAERQAASVAEAAESQAASMAATADADSEAAEVVEQTVTEETARSSTEEFATDATASQQAETTATAETQQRSSGLDELGRIALFGLGALAVGQILKNGSEVVSNSGDRVVVQQQDGSYRVYKNDDVLMFQPGTDVKTFAYDDGSTRTVATREDGTQIETIRAADGTVLRRTRILNDGTQVVLFDDTQVAEQVQVNQLPQVTDTNRSINVRQAEEDQLRAALAANMPQEVDRRFSLSQIRNINAVRGLVPEIDVDNINFETGSSTIRPEEAEELAQMGTLMRQRIEENPGEVFLIEGHTDAVGSASYNLALSDRRAESVALALTEYFDVPPENMVVQGYGESDLKIRTAAAERENRRASVRRITPLLNGG